MKRTTALLAGVCALAFARAAAAKDDDVTKNLDLKGFDRIDISGVFEMDVRVGPDFSIELSGPEYEMEITRASVKNGVLHLDQKDHHRHRRNNRENVRAVITMPDIAGFDVSGVVDGSVAGVDAGDFEIDISGVADLKVDGECDNLRADVSGVGDLDADALECRVVKVRVSGVGDASVFARDEVDAHVSGMGEINVYGSPKRVSKSAGMFGEITVH